MASHAIPWLHVKLLNMSRGNVISATSINPVHAIIVIEEVSKSFHFKKGGGRRCFEKAREPKLGDPADQDISSVDAYG